MRNFDAIEKRVNAGRLSPKFELEAIGTLMVGGDYPRASSPAVGDLAMFMLTAAEKLAAIIVRLVADRDGIIEDQSRYVMRPK